MKNIPKILVTPGEPSGIGYDILLDLAEKNFEANIISICLLYTSPSPRDGLLSRMPSSA